MPTSELNDDNRELPRLIKETPDEKVEREKRDTAFRKLMDDLTSKIAAHKDFLKQP